MPLLVEAVIRRNLGSAPSFVDAREKARPTELAIVHADEEVVGWYMDPSASSREPSLIFTKTAIYHVHAESYRRVAFRDILRYELPESKMDASGVVVLTRTERIVLPMRGRNGVDNRYCDAWGLVQMLHTILRYR
jgi:hypothetical protein